MFEYTPRVTLTGIHAPENNNTFPEDNSRKGQTAKRLKEELAEDLAATDRAARTYFSPARKGNSLNPNAAFAFDCVDSHFLNREAHEEAKAIQQAWRRKPWKGFVWYGRIHEPNSKPERVWLAPSMDLQWTGAEWEPYKGQDGTTVVTTGAIPSNVSMELTEALQRAVEVGKSGGIAEVEMNAAYIEYEADPTGQRDSLFVTLSAFVRSAKRLSQVSRKFKNKPEIYIDLDDIFNEFAVNLIHRIENGQYTHEGKMQNWISFIWGNFFFKGVETKIYGYENRNYFVNTLDKDLEGYEDQEHSVGLYQLEDEQAQREQVGYAAPISRDRIFRHMDKTTQDIVRMLCEGMSRKEVAVNLNISDRQLLRRLKVATEDGEAVLNSLSHTLQACAEDQGSNLVCIDAGEDYGGFVGDIQASAEELAFEPLLSAREAAQLLGIHEKTIQALARSGEVPCLRFGKYWRFRASVLDTWVRERLISDHQSRRAS
jgi:excisionase family DNA binding protein